MLASRELEKWAERVQSLVESFFFYFFDIFFSLSYVGFRLFLF
jgi:hypothetical protein